MAEQIYLKSNEFARLVDCPMDEEEYRHLLIERDAIEGDFPGPRRPSVVNFSDAQVSRVQSVLEDRMADEDYDYDHRRSALYGAIADGRLQVEKVKALQKRGVLEEASIEVQL